MYIFKRKLKPNFCLDETSEFIFNGVSSRAVPPRMFCDICDQFDLHETEDCPTQVRVILYFRLVSVKQNLPSKLKFIIVGSIHFWSSQISPFEKGSSDFYSQRAGFLRAKNY